MKKILIACLCISMLVLTNSCGTGKAKVDATATIVKGTVTVVNAGVERALAPGGRLSQGDLVRTAADGAVILSLNDGSAKFEIQPDSEFDLGTVTSLGKSFSVKKGCVWTWVEKLRRDQTFTVDTPTAVVGVRGTKFYVFRQGDMDGICHCEGDVQTVDKTSGQQSNDKQDSLTFTRNGKSITLTQDDLASVGFHHNHSVIDESPVGAKNKPDAATEAKIAAIVARKFKDAQ